MSLRDKLEKEVESQLLTLEDMEFGSEQYESAIKCISMLTDKINELDKNEKERKSSKEKYIEYGINVGGIVLPLLVTIWGTKLTFKFEEEGTITTSIGRNFINKIVTKK